MNSQQPLRDTAMTSWRNTLQMSNENISELFKARYSGLNAKIDYETADRNKILRKYFGSIQTVYNC